MPSGLPTIPIKDHQFDFIPNHPKDQIDYSSWRTCVVCNAIYNIIAKIRGRIFLKSEGMMRYYKRHQGSSFMFGSRRWFMNNIKYAQDWRKRAVKQVFYEFWNHGESWRGKIGEVQRSLTELVDCPLVNLFVHVLHAATDQLLAATPHLRSAPLQRLASDLLPIFGLHAGLGLPTLVF